jgi:hypothetical protein
MHEQKQPAGSRLLVMEIGLPRRFDEGQVVFLSYPDKGTSALAQLEAELELLLRRRTAGLKAEVERLQGLLDAQERQESAARAAALEARARDHLIVRC